jgi:uncharacterized protein
MPLADLQKAFGILMLETEGLSALRSDEDWVSFTQTGLGQVIAQYPRERLVLYEELLFNTVEDTMQGFFPFCKRFIEEDQWVPLIERYRRAYPNRSYYLYKVGQDFPQFLTQDKALVEKFPFLPDLALYQWLEIEIHNLPNFTYPLGFQPDLTWTPELIENRAPFWNPAAKLVSLSYPIPALIHHIKQLIDEEPELDVIPEGVFQVTEQPTMVFIYRDPETFQKRLFEVNSLTASLLHLSAASNQSFLELFQTLQATTPALQNLPLETIVVEGIKLLQNCHQQNMLLGSFPR